MPTREASAVAALALLIFLVAFNLQAGWVYAVDALLVGLLLIGAVSARLSVRGLTVRRAMPAETVEGEPVRVTLTLTAPGRAAPRFFLEVMDAVPGLLPARAFVPILRPGRAEQVAYTSTAVRRGVHAVGSAIARSAGLTGLFAARRRVRAPGGITVYPRYWKISRCPLLGQTPAPETPGSARRRGGLEFYGLRDYRQGDSLRHVHWRSTARRGTPVVREFEQEIPGSVTLLLDTRPLGADRARGPHDAGGDGAFEDLVRAAASIAWFVTTMGGAIRLLLARGERAVDVGGGWRDILRALADVEPDGALSPADVYARTAPRREASCVVLARDLDAVTDLVHRGVRPAAILANPAGPPAASTPADDGALPRDGESPRHDSAVALRALGIPVCVLRSGDDIGARLEQSG